VSNGKPAVVFLKQGTTPSGKGVALVLKHLVRRIRKHWPAISITFRSDSHYGRPEAMEWCQANGIGYIFGLAGNSVLRRQVYEAGDALKVTRAEQGADKLRGFTGRSMTNGAESPMPSVNVTRTPAKINIRNRLSGRRPLVAPGTSNHQPTDDLASGE
jgi:hypothetical protein